MAPRAPASAAAEEIPEVAEHRRLVGQNPDGLTFTISLPDGTRFRQGERISVELAFSSSLPDTFKLNGALYDRSGRLKVDEYRVFPAGTSDPLADYFGTETGFAGGGLRTMPVLGREPKRLRFDLNEWQRFDEPGHYQLYVVSQRLRWEHRDAADAGIQSHAVTSQNIVSFDVVPAERAWQERTLKAALAVLDSGKSSEDDQREAVRTLRFLDTEAAVRAMGSRLDHEGLAYSLSFALYAMRHRGAAIEELQARLAQADTPFTNVMLSTLVMLRLWHEDAPGSKHAQEHWARVRDEVVEQLIRALPQKGLQARALCVDALLSFGGQLSPEQAARGARGTCGASRPSRCSPGRAPALSLRAD